MELVNIMAHPCRVRLGVKRYPEKYYVQKLTPMDNYVIWYTTDDKRDARVFLTKSSAKQYIELRPSLVAFIEPIPKEENLGRRRETLSEDR